MAALPLTIILLNVQWYCRYALSDRNVEAIMADNILVAETELRQSKHLTNVIKQDQQ